MSNPKRGRLVILHVLAPAPFGGLEQVVHTLARRQQAHGHVVHVAAIIGTHEQDHPFLARAGEHVPVHPIVTKARDYAGERRRVAELCERLRPDVVHTHGYRADVVDARAARARGFPIVSTVHGFTRNGWKNRTYEWLQRRSYRGFDAVVAVSRAQLDELLRTGSRRERLHCVPNAWTGRDVVLARADARARLGLEQHAFVVGYVGRLGYEKGPDVLVDACSGLRDVQPLTVSFIGDGVMRTSLEERAVAAGVSGMIRWHGVIPDAGGLFSAFDVFVLSSRTEGTPMVLFEAMAAGVPIVAARIGGVPDVVTEQEAHLVPPVDPRALATAIADIVSDPERALCRAAAARQRLADGYDADVWVDQYVEIYRGVRKR